MRIIKLLLDPKILLLDYTGEKSQKLRGAIILVFFSFLFQAEAAIEKLD